MSVPSRLGALLAAAVVSLSTGSALAADPELVARGDYLVNTIMACGNCHTPQGPAGPDMSRNLGGGLLFDTPAFRVAAPNLTAHADGLGAWSDAEITAAIVDGVGRDGRSLAPIMPSGFYRVLSPRDLESLVAYLRTVSPVAGVSPAPEYRAAVPHAVPPGAEKPIAEAERSDPVRAGFYLATIGHCMECHTTREGGVPDFANGLGAGGEPFPGPWGVSVSANITPSGIGGWSDEAVAAAITRGVRPDGSPLKPPMGYAHYAGMTAQDLGNLVAYLRTLPPRPSRAD